MSREKKMINRKGKIVHIERDPIISQVINYKSDRDDYDVLAVLTSDWRLLFVIKDKCAFIIEREECLDDCKYVHYLAAVNNSKTGDWELKDYIMNGHSSKIEEVRAFPMESPEGCTFREEGCVLRDNAFLIHDAEGARIYNLKKLSKPFRRVFNDERLGDNVVMVEEEVECDGIAKDALIPLKDYIIYGIDTETYEIVTPIWSQMQSRYIPLYTKEYMEEYNRQNESNPFDGFDIEHSSLGEITIGNEVRQTLRDLSYYLSRRPSKEELEGLLEAGQLREGFVEGFRKRK